MDKILISKINIYRGASKRNYIKYKSISSKKNKLLATPNLFLLGDDFNEALCEFCNQEETHKMACIVFQAMAIEAFLNEYIYIRVGKSYFNSMDKLSPSDKLIVACKLITDKDFPKDCHAFELLKKTIKYRNSLVHYKVREVDIEKFLDSTDDISEQEMDDISMTYDKLVEKLNSLDDDFDSKYLIQIPDDFWNVSY